MIYSIHLEERTTIKEEVCGNIINKPHSASLINLKNKLEALGFELKTVEYHND
jgi:hypothetical protein